MPREPGPRTEFWDLLGRLSERVRKLEVGAVKNVQPSTGGGTAPKYAHFSMSNDAGGSPLDTRFGANRQSDWMSVPLNATEAGSDAGFCEVLTAAQSLSGRAGAVRIHETGLYVFTLKLSAWLNLQPTGTKSDGTSVTPAYDGSVWGIACDAWYSDPASAQSFDAWYDVHSQRGTIEQGKFGVMDRTLSAIRRITVAEGDFEVDVRCVWAPDNVANSGGNFTGLITINGDPAGQYATTLSVVKLA